MLADRLTSDTTSDLRRRLSASAGSGFLRPNDEAYSLMAARIGAAATGGEPEALLQDIAQAALIAASFHCGRFADGAIENVSLEIGRRLETSGGWQPHNSDPAGTRRRRILHVATSVAASGGHTRMLAHWARNDTSSHHSLVLLNQGSIPVPAWLADAIQGSGGRVVEIPTNAPRCEKARRLRLLARARSNLVVLHHDVCEVVPTLAFATEDCPPVAVVNVADHQFWLGSSVSDIGISLRSLAREYAERRRFIRTGAVLPVPLPSPAAQLSRGAARSALGVPSQQLMLLSIGRAEKYRPYGAYDFVSTAAKILERRRNAHIYVVGESLEGIKPYLRCAVPERLHFVGEQEDHSLYRAAADLYIESFPFGSHTALLEGALSGLAVVPAYAPLFPLLVANDDSVHDLVTNPASEQDYIERIDQLVEDSADRASLGGTLRDRLIRTHVGEGWLEQLAVIYRHTDAMSHQASPIPESKCEETPADIGLSLWHAMADGRTYSIGGTHDGEAALLRHFTALMKQAGDYGVARRSAWWAVRSAPRQLSSWRILATTMIGSREHFPRRVLGI